MNKIFKIKFIVFLILTACFFLSLSQHVVYGDSKLAFLIVFIVIEVVLILTFFKGNYIYYNLIIILLINLFTTPLFFRLDFDLPYRKNNSEEVLIYSENFKNGKLKGKHLIKTDTKGFRVNKKIDYKNKSDNSFRAIAIGASTTEEEGLDENKIWTNLLINKIKLHEQNKLDNYEIINMGVGGLRIIHHYFALKRNFKLKPDLVIFLTGINDWNYHVVHREKKFVFNYYEYNFDFKKSLIFKFITNVNKSLKKKLYKPKKEINKKVIEKNKYEDLITKQTNFKKKIKKEINFRPNNVYYEYNYWLNTIIKFCKKNKVNCLFVDQPTLYKDSINLDLRENLWINPPFVDYKINFDDNVYIANFYNKFLKDKVEEHSLNFCKISDKIPANKENFIDDAHFTPEGSKLVAQNIFNCIKN